MRKILIILLFVPCLAFGQVKEDKVLHFVAGYIIASPVTAVTLEKGWDKSMIYAFGATALTGVGKESYDYFVEKEKFDVGELGFTMLGGLTANLFIGLLDTKIIPFIERNRMLKKHYVEIGMIYNF